MNYTKVDTVSLSFPISYFKKIFSEERFRLARSLFHHRVNPLVLLDHFSMNSTFEDFSQLNEDIYCGLMNEFLYNAIGHDFGIEGAMKKGKNFFKHMYTFEGGFIAWGGNNKFFNLMGEVEFREERIQIYLDGSFCEKVLKNKHLRKMRKRLIQHEGKLTRLDICLDFIDGEHTIDGAIDCYENGEFQAKKSPKNPLARHIRELSNTGCGETLYVGSRLSGKLVRLYEKGKQLGDSFSEWLRVEVEFNTNNKRVISPDALLETDKAFSSAYPYCMRILNDLRTAFEEQILSGDYDLIQIVKDEKRRIGVKVMIKHAQRSYGKLVNFLKDSMNPDQIIAALSRDGIPERLELA